MRQAFALVIDREILANIVMKGYVFPATGGFVPLGMPGHSAEIGLPYDPERARDLMAEAGYPGGRGFPSVNSLTRSTSRPYPKYLQEQWRENLGVEITWEALELATLLDRLRKDPPHVFLTGWGADYPDPDNFLRVGFPWQASGWWNEEYDRLVEKARRITDQGKRIKLYRQADRILVEEAAIIPLYHERLDLLVKPWIRRYPASAVGGPIWKDVIIEPH